MHKVQNLPRKVFSFAKYPLAIYAGYLLMTIYLMSLTKQTVATLDTITTLAPVNIAWAIVEDADVGVVDVQSALTFYATETYEIPYEVLPEHKPEIVETVLVEDYIDCTGVLEKVGASSFCYTYMGWQMITNTESSQYQFRTEHFPDWDHTYGCESAFNDEGFAMVDNRYVVATTNADDGGLFHIGDKFTAVLENGETIPCVVGEVKSVKDPNWTPYGHLHGAGLCMLEFLVDKEMWYPQNHSNPGTKKCMPQWDSALLKLIKE